MQMLNNGITRFFDLLLAPLAAWPYLAMIVVALITAVWALLLFKAVTPQDRLTRVRDRLFGHIYEMGLYQEHLRVVGRIQWDLARANLRYLSLTLPALVVLTIPMILTLAQLEGRFGHRPLRVGEETVFSVALSPDQQLGPDQVDLVTSAGLTIVAGPVRDRVANELAWRVRVTGEGDQELIVSAAGRTLASRKVPVGGGLPVVAEKNSTGLLHTILYPGAPRLPGDGALSATRLGLPPRAVSYFSLRMDWLVAFMVFSLLAGLAVKDALRVSI